MITEFQVEIKKRHGNLHIAPQGNLDGDSAHQLLRVLHANYEGRGRVFISTLRLNELSPDGCRVFQRGLDAGLLPLERLFFKGEKGIELAPRGSRVLILGPHARRCHCSGRCAVCKCAQKAALAS